MDKHHALLGQIGLTVDAPTERVLRLSLTRSGTVLGTLDQPIVHNADEILLTGVDKLLQRSRIDRSALEAVELGSGIDKNSSLYRIVTSFASALVAVQKARNKAA